MNTEIKSLIRLLNDSDKEVFNIVEKELIKKGVDIVASLEEAWENTLDEILQERIEKIILIVQFNDIYAHLKNWAEERSENLLEGAFCIAKYQYPDLKLSSLEKEINNLIKDASEIISENLTPLEKVRTLNHIIYSVYKFSRNNNNFYAPKNSYLNLVFETKKGNSITLAIIYLVVSQKLNLPIYGVNLPRNFILAYINPVSKNNEDILFYINPYNKGSILRKQEIDNFIEQQKLEKRESFYTVCSNIEIIKRLILSLIYSYDRLGYPEKTTELEKLYNIL